MASIPSARFRDDGRVLKLMPEAVNERDGGSGCLVV